MAREQDQHQGQSALSRTTLDPLRVDERPDEAFETTWRRAYRQRLLMLGSVLALWTAGIGARLAYLQIVRHPDYLIRANDQQNDIEELAPKRAEILDRNGEVLAYSVDADTVVASPRDIEDPATAVSSLCAVFADCSKGEVARLTAQLGKSNWFAYVRRGVSRDVARRVMALELPGIRLETETKRYYPKRDLAAHVVGFVDRDNVGLGGVEAAFDDQIRGKPGRVLRVIDARQNTVGRHVQQEPTAGATLELTIDETLQFYAERELKFAVETHRARAGTLIAMDPMTGGVLAMANYPTFNANAPNGVSAAERRNRATQEIYDPGSTFKMVTAAAAIEEGVLSPSDLIDTSPGFIRVSRDRLVDDTHSYGVLTFEDVIVKSSNVGAIKAGWMIGAERLNRYIHRFGFGENLASKDFRGASRGIVWAPEKLDDSALASVSMGYQISVTPLQMVNAVAAVANGGTLFQPHIVGAVIRDGQRTVQEPVVVRQAIAPATAAALTTIMEAVVDHGTATQAQIEGYQVAGKTGTVQKVINGRYSDTEHTGSFIGFVPSRRPALAILVVIDQPQEGGYFGGVVAAPAFQRFATAALRYLGVPETINPISPVLVSTDPTLLKRPESAAPAMQSVVFTSSGQLVMPDVTGLGARDATRLLIRAGLGVRLGGDGVVVTQFPEAGTPVDRGETGVLTLQRAQAAPVPAGGGRQ